MDIWSLACCIVQMATGRRPWSTLENEWSVMYHVVTGHPPLPDPSQLSTLGIDFLKKCFTRSPMKRPTATELLSHPWITSYLESYYNEDGEIVMPQPDMYDSNSAAGGYKYSDEGMRSVGSVNSYERPLVRSIPNSLAIEGMADSHINGAQTQAYFREIATQHAQDLAGEPVNRTGSIASNNKRSIRSMEDDRVVVPSSEPS